MSVSLSHGLIPWNRKEVIGVTLDHIDNSIDYTLKKIVNESI